MFIALGGVGAYATHPGGTNTIDTNDVIDGTLKARDLENFAVNKNKIGPDAVSTTKVQNNTLKGDDIDEASLGPVTSSLLGGLGRSGVRQNGSTGPGSCNPETTDLHQLRHRRHARPARARACPRDRHSERVR